MPEDRPISARKAESNRRNALRSTGPRSAAGKASSSRNALKHGLSARGLPVEDENAVNALAAALLAEYPHADRSSVLEVARLEIDLLRARKLRSTLVAASAAVAASPQQSAPNRQDNEPVPSLEKLLAALIALDRYERHALSRRRRALRTLLAATRSSRRGRASS
jgi:hypothetical protein